MKQLILQMIEARENERERLQQLKKMCTNEKKNSTTFWLIKTNNIQLIKIWLSN